MSAALSDLLAPREAASPLALDLLRLGIAIYGADKVALRSDMDDRWTRSLELRVPVSDVKRWRASAAAFEGALRFLTNDQWSLGFRYGKGPDGPAEQLLPADAVCLFSGGLDSLAGAIDLLEDGNRVVLVGHYDSNPLRPRQVQLFERLRNHYGPERVAHRPFYARAAGATEQQVRPLPAVRESTTRSRSFLFISAASAVASAHGLDRIYMPENGYIGLNVPLEMSRLGACSTRTTHPHFMQRLADAFDQAGVAITIENPFRLKTKAEVLRDCRNQDLLASLVPETVSCAHPELGRWTHEGYRNCGYCYPCVMRRVSLFALGADDASSYRIDVGDPAFLGTGGGKAEHLRALLTSDARPTRPSDVLSAGPLPRGEASAFADLYTRGRLEVSAWLRSTVPGSG